VRRTEADHEIGHFDNAVFLDVIARSFPQRFQKGIDLLLSDTLLFVTAQQRDDFL
jgi:hypothetical protein